MKHSTNNVPKRTKKLIFHDLATKLAAVKRVNTLLSKGTSKTKAHMLVAKGLQVTPSTIHNWCQKHALTSTRVNTVTANGRLTIQSLNIKTIDGVTVRLTPGDIKGIAEYAALV